MSGPAAEPLQDSLRKLKDTVDKLTPKPVEKITTPTWTAVATKVATKVLDVVKEPERERDRHQCR